LKLSKTKAGNEELGIFKYWLKQIYND
jgi:hypothetical protein